VIDSRQPISRRTVLRGAGVVLGLPFLDAMLPWRPLLSRGVRAAPPARPPVRMAFLYMPNGVNPHTWTPQGFGSDFPLSPALEPLAPVRGDVLVLTDLMNAATDTGDGHYFKSAAFLTGTTIARSTGSALSSGGVSIDQLAAQRVGHFTRVPSLELGIEPVRTGVDVNVGITQLYGGHISWSTPTTPIAKEIDPRLAFERLFSTGTGAAATASSGQRSVVDRVLDDAQSLKGRLGKADRRKLEEYLDSVRSVEQRIEFDARRREAEVRSDPLAREAIERLGARIKSWYEDPTRLRERRGEHTEHVKLMLDILALSFWTDTTRVGTFMFGNAVSGRNFSFLEGVKGGHHQTSHHENDPAKLKEYTLINAWHVKQYAYLVDRLRSIREGDGTLLDNCMILFGAGLRDGNSHNPHNLPILLAGRGGGTIATGRHVRYEKDTPLCNLYVGMLRRMGAATNRFGDSTRELPGLDDAGFAGKRALRV